MYGDRSHDLKILSPTIFWVQNYLGPINNLGKKIGVQKFGSGNFFGVQKMMGPKILKVQFLTA